MRRCASCQAHQAWQRDAPCLPPEQGHSQSEKDHKQALSVITASAFWIDAARQAGVDVVFGLALSMQRQARLEAVRQAALHLDQRRPALMFFRWGCVRFDVRFKSPDIAAGRLIAMPIISECSPLLF
jgi:hypothetical protein